MVGGRVVGDGQQLISHVASLSEAQEGALTFYGSATFRDDLHATKASCVIIQQEHAGESPTNTMIIADRPYDAFVTFVKSAIPNASMPQGMRAGTATIDPSAVIEPTASVGPGCVIGSGAVLEQGVQLVANVVVYPGVVIGRDTIVHGNVTISTGCIIGDRCIIHAGSVVGSDGFGYVENSDKSFTKIPQIGNVRIGNDVEIGANVAIDRAALGSTVIGDGVKIDNLVQIAHGVEIGSNTAIASQTGIAGGTTIGHRNRLAGQVGIVGHIQLADDVIIMAQSGVGRTIEQPGVYSGSPSRDHRSQLRINAALNDLVAMRRQLAELQSLVERLQKERNDEL